MTPWTTICTLATMFAPVDPPASESVAQRRAELAKLSAHQVAELRADAKQFDALAKEKQTALLELAEALAKAPDRVELEQTMIRFARWVDTLTPTQRQRLDAAATTSERLAVVRMLMDEQKQSLERDLKRLREHEWSSVEPSATGFAAFPRAFGPEIQERIKALNSNMSRSEKRLRDQLRATSPRDASLYQLLLVAKYAGGAPLTGNVDWIARFLPRAFQQTEFYSTCFGRVPIDQLSLADRTRLRELLELSFAMPEVSPRMVFDAYPVNDPRRKLYTLMHESFSVRPFALVYFFDRPGELAIDKRIRFERLQKTVGGSHPAPEVRPQSNPRDKTKRFLKKAAKDTRDG